MCCERAENQAGRVCVVRFPLLYADWSHWAESVKGVFSPVFAVAVLLPTIVVCSTAFLSWGLEVKKKKTICSAGWKLLRMHSPSCGPWEPLSDCSLSMWLGFRCLPPASVNSKKKEASVVQREQKQAAELHTRERALQRESTSVMVTGATIGGLGNLHLTTRVSRCTMHSSIVQLHARDCWKKQTYMLCLNWRI